MKLELRSRRINGAGDLTGTVAIRADDGQLVFEDVVNLSKFRQREALITEVAERAKVTTDKARTEVLQLMEAQRADHMEPPGEPPQRERKADKLVAALLNADIELFHDQALLPHLAITDGDSRNIYRLCSSLFKDRLSHLSFTVGGEVPSTETVRAAINVLCGKAIYEGSFHRLHVRTAWHDDALWYDLGDSRAVRSTPGGWTIESRPPILFRRYPHQKPQVEPVSGGELQDVLRFVNLQDDSMRLLFITDLVAGLIPSIPRPVSVFHGPHGSAKSTAALIKRALQDPVEVPIQGMPRDVGELVQIGSHNLCLFVDNVSSLPEWFSDALSRFCSGDGFVKRQLYTDDDDIVFRPQGIGGITGINLVAQKRR